jgi:hypothetical protein
MNSTSRLAVFAVLLLLAIAVFDSILTRRAVAAVGPIPEQYCILSLARGETDVQLADQLNGLARDGWRLRCSIPNGVILAR